jgi:MYXO-CTERM domain-containing protein
VVGWLAVASLWLGPTRLAEPPPRDEILGGEVVQPGEYEEVVALLVAGQVVCSGTRIAPGLVLTAGHCLTRWSPELMSVATGVDGETGPRTQVLATGVHPEFCDCDEDAFDYGYVQVLPGALDTEAVATLIVDQAEWDDLVDADTDVTIVGYGDDPAHGETARTKRKVTVPIHDGSPSGQEFAAGGDFRDSCGGDSGGPVFVELPDGTRRQIGITSRGSDPCGEGGVYANPYPALGWLRAETGVDLCGDPCGSCDCLDTTLPEQARGCGCTGGAPRGAWWTIALVGLLARRRRR